ncbi:YtxH domain-containing protein [Clostridium taeniosporum]|uniref:YtxH domain-containing protein n=1 Tax=Clostridium taeniosporum TaxID=394958 RepID=A0A1D7XJW2_9CLOT|nr:YtxH domain-containing protein [Clostridium taeniosporum]AOR23617.1 YtxH domain-containing protein [Clostridium taeniosporum]
MKRKSILALLLSTLISCSMFVGCGPNNTSDNVNNNEKNNMEETGENVKEDVEDLGNDVKDTTKNAGESIKYTAINFKDDIVNAGQELKDAVTGNEKNYFSGKETDYMVGNDYVRVYEYEDINKANEDIKRISENGMTIEGSTADYTRKPYYYRKGNTLVVYEGNDPAYVKQFKDTLGEPIR